jgi:hypothetical protein
MNLPQGSFWGWTNYRWGVDGSGFIWYGLNQPILDRAFDVWNLKNETYYWELISALQQKNPNALNNIINKYSVEYIIFDKSVYFSDEKIFAKLASPQLDFINQIDNLKLVKNIGSIFIYQNQNPTKIYTTNNLDNSLPISHFDPNLQIQSLPSSNIIYPLEHGSISGPKTTKVLTDNELYFHFQNQQSHNILGFNFPDFKFDQDYLLKIESRNFSGETPIISTFDNNLHYYFFKNQLKKSTDWQTTWFLIPKMENFSFDLGLTILFDNPSFNKIDSINDIKNPEIYPYQTNISLIENYQPPVNNYLESKSNIFFYKTKLNPNNDSYLVLPQSFHQGWLTFYFNGFKPVFLKDHVLINNWANGWNISNLNNQSSNVLTLYIIFWPQILEFIGFILLIPTFIWIFKKEKQ